MSEEYCSNKSLLLSLFTSHVSNYRQAMVKAGRVTYLCTSFSFSHLRLVEMKKEGRKEKKKESSLTEIIFIQQIHKEANICEIS
ncbi:CLUMA_CG002844, isoform A [Clunio marinus]|uniref:CLUMA_CG002844, isoform A n=1 Tax=Clunio marinus TaxID=568069 RepID=A0A1J1HLU2_9DIPT|nr:CLUMA_CG002844, isoform A [Clunio marinus]